MGKSQNIPLNKKFNRKSFLSLGRKAVWAIGPPILGALVAFAIGAVIVFLSKADPLVTYKQLVIGAFGGKRQLTETILKATPLLFIGLGLIVAFKAKIWNIGGEGQFFMGALFGSFVALKFPELPSAIMIPSIFIAGMIGGALWGLIPALLRIYRGINVIISTLMLNYVALFLLEYAARVPLRDPNGFLPESAQFVKAARLTGLFGTRIHIGTFIAVLLIPIIYVLIWRTPIGFRLRAIGSKVSVARFAGIDIAKNTILVMVFSGALAGLAGIIEVSFLHSRLKGGISGGYGFSGILVALLGRLHPVGALFSAVFFAALNNGAYSTHTLLGLPITLADTLQAIMVLVVLGMDAYFRLWRIKNDTE